ncbi:L-galactonate dehydratase [Exophiala xenobiotica]|nr:L-galactonate dehydratase [Exophiala xenobiotica]
MASQTTINSFETHDLRWPTSLTKTGSDAMNDAADYSAAYIILHTSDAALAGHGFTFTIGRGNDIVCQAIKYVAERLVGKSLCELTSDMGATWRYLVSDSHLRWIGPEKGVIHLATGAVVNALWDLWAKSVGKPVWQLVVDMTPEEYVRCVDFRYIVDAITPEEAVEMLRDMAKTKGARVKDVKEDRAVPAYTTSAGWLGYSDEKMTALLRDSMAAGFHHFKFKVGTSLEQDRRRLKLARDVIGHDGANVLMVDANQVWSVPEAIEYMEQLVEFKPWFIEEPTSPDDILGHAAIRKALSKYGVGVATGEHCQNRVIFKQLLQAGAIDVCQIDACRLGGVNEVMAVLLMAKKFGIPVIPHSGGVGLTEYTQQLSTIDYVVVSGQRSLLEYIDNVEDSVKVPTRTKDGYFVTPLNPGYGVEYTAKALAEYEFPHGRFWSSDKGLGIVQGSNGF